MAIRIIVTAAMGFLLIALCIYLRQRDRDTAARKHGCSPVVQHRTIEPFAGLDYHIIMHTEIPSIYRYHQRHGKTFQIRPWISLPSFATIAPENIRIINAGKDWGIESMRLPGGEFFCGRGFLTTDGDVWQRSRKLLKPTFAKKNIQDLDYLSQQVDDMFAQLPNEGTTVDLQPLFYTMFLNTSIKFLLGIDPTKGFTGAPSLSEEFIAAFHDALFLTMFRMLLGRVWSLLPQKRYLRVCKTTHDYIDYAIARALNGVDEHSAGDASIDEARKQPSMLGGLSIQTDDREFIRSQILQGMMASQETTSALLGNACFLLSRHAKYWQQIRLAVLERELHDFDFDTLLNFKLIQNVLLETLRLYPIFTLMGRAALQDTTLPVGGGPAQDEPIFVPKGAVAVMHYYALHRDPSVYGEDVETFRPERWETVHPSNWEFMGFGGGNRECLGRQKVLVEAAYVLVRLAQRFEVLESRDEQDWVGELKMTCKSKNGCKVALYRDSKGTKV